MTKTSIIWGLLFLIPLSLSARSFEEDHFVYANRYSESPRDFKKALKKFLSKVYESDQPIFAEEMLGLVKKCNENLSLRDPQTFKNGFNACMDFYFFSLWAGVGNFDMTYSDPSDKQIIINGGASFIGGQIHFPYSLSSRIIIEGKYWYFPNLATTDTVSQDVSKATLFQGSVTFQKRFFDSAWSSRYGLNFVKSPTLRNLSESILLENVQLNYRTVYSAGPTLGYKYAFDRNKMIKHLAYVDFTPFLFSDGKWLNEPTKNFSIKLGYKYYLHRRWAITIDLEKNQFFSKDDIESNNLVYGLGLQLFTF